MAKDPTASVYLVTERLRERAQQIVGDLRHLATQPDGVNSGAQIEIASDDLKVGTDQLASAVEHLARIDPALTRQLMIGLEQLAEGMFASGALLSRDEAVARRFRNRGAEIARATRAHKLRDEHYREADIIREELMVARREQPGLSADKLAGAILASVNDRLREAARMRSLKAKTLSKTTIWRRIRDFNL